MKLIIGIGNPGVKYANNRHNVGYMVIDALNSADLPSGIIAKKTETFMNESGGFVKNQMSKSKCQMSDLYIIHDDLDIQLGQYKIQNGVGPKVHNGVNSIESILNDSDFWRVRIGVDNRRVSSESRVPNVSSVKTPGNEYVLSDFTEDEKKNLDEVIKKIVRDLRGLNN